MSDLRGSGPRTVAPAALAANDPSGFRDHLWGSRREPAMQLVWAASPPVACATYKRNHEAMNVGTVGLHRIEYGYHNEQLVEVALTAFGDSEELRQITETKFGPLQPVGKFTLGNLVGWPFNSRNGMPIEGLSMRYKQGPNTTVCVFTWDSGGYLTKVILMSTEEAVRREAIRTQLLQGAASGL